MAGAGSAYVRLQVPQDGLSQSLQYWGGLDAQQAALKRAEKKKANDDAFAALQMADKEFEATVTGFDVYDDVIRDYSQRNVDEYTNWAEIGARAIGNDDATYRKALYMQKKLKSNFSYIKGVSSNLKEVADDYFKKASEGKISAVDEEYEKVMQAISRNDIKIVNDERGIPYFEALLTGDDGEKKYKKIKASDIVNGQYRPYEVFQLEGETGWVNTVAKGMGLTKVKKAEGWFWDTTKEEWGAKNDAALNSRIEGIINDPRAMSSVLYQATGRKKKEKFDATDEADVKTYLTNLIRGNIKEEDLTESNSGRMSYSLSKEEKQAEVYEAELITNEDGTAKTEEIWYDPANAASTASTAGQRGNATMLKADSYTLKSKKGEPLKGLIPDDENAEMLTFYRTKEGQYYGKVRSGAKVSEQEGGGQGNMLSYKGGEDQQKTTTTKTATNYRTVPLSDDTVNRLARAFGLDNAGQLDNYLDERKSKVVKSSEPTNSSRFNPK